MKSRPLTQEEKMLAASIFGAAIRYDDVRVYRRRWWPFQPRHITMAPDGHIWFHPKAEHYCGDFCGSGSPTLQGHFLHEMTHVWQAQTRGRWYLPLMRHPFCRYDYVLIPGKPFHHYGLEQQAEIIRHIFLLRQGIQVEGKPPLDAYTGLLPFLP